MALQFAPAGAVQAVIGPKGFLPALAPGISAVVISSMILVAAI